MKFAEYMAWILLCKQGKYGEKKLLQFQKYRIVPRGLLFGAPCRVATLATKHDSVTV